EGFDLNQIIAIVAFQALALGLAASLAGLALGDVLARTFFHQTPAYLAVAFPITIYQSIHLWVVLLAVAGGLLATLLASLPPVLGLRNVRRPSKSPKTPSSQLSRSVARILGIAGFGLVAVVTLLVM